MSTTTITRSDRPEIFDHELDIPTAPTTAPRASSDERDRMFDYVIAESREQRARERRREEQRAAAHRRRTRGALATGTVAIVIAAGGTLFFLEGPSHGTGPQTSGGTPAAAKITPATPPSGPNGGPPGGSVSQ